MSKTQKEAKTVKSYTAKEVFKSQLPWQIIMILAIAISFSILGWFGRSSFDNIIKSEVQAQVHQMSKANQ